MQTRIKNSQILSHDYRQLNDKEKVEYTKAYIVKYLKEIFYNLSRTKVRGLHDKLHQLIDKINEVHDISSLDSLLVAFAIYLESWRSDNFMERGMEGSVNEIANQIKKMLQMAYNFDFFTAYGVDIPGVNTLQNKKLKSEYEHYTKGLSPRTLREIANEGVFGIMYVSGSGMNIYGHTLLLMGKSGGDEKNKEACFIHIDTPYGYPKFMSADQFNAYIRREGKTILGVHRAVLKYPNKVVIALNEFCQKKYAWLGVVHNCLEFCNSILARGGFNPKQLLLKLPTSQLNQTPENALIFSMQQEEVITQFSAELLKHHALTRLSIVEAFRPVEIIKLLEFIDKDVNKVVQWQVEIIRKEAMNVTEYSLLNIAATHVLSKIESIEMALRKDYALLVDQVIVSPIFAALIDAIKEQLESTQKQARFYMASLSPTFFASKISEHNLPSAELRNSP